MKEDYQVIINRAYNAMSKWNLLHVLFIFPLGIGFFLFAAYYIPVFGKIVSQSGILGSIIITKLEQGIGLSGEMIGIFFFLFWFLYSVMYIISKRHRLQSYIFNQIIFSGMMGLVYYAMFYGSQLMVPFFTLRMVNWLLFSASIVFILVLPFINDDKIRSVLIKIDHRSFSSVLVLLWVGNICLSFLINGFDQLVARLCLAAIPILPLLLIVIFIKLFQAQLSLLNVLYIIHKNQEHYRPEFGYSVEEWYGKKSKKAKEQARKS